MESLINWSTLPSEMRLANRWVLWRYEMRKGKKTKIPFQPNGKKASVSSSLTWSTFESVAEAHRRGGFEGLGFVLGNGFVGIDLDDCIQDGELTAGAKAILDLLDTYCEISPSGKGVHAICQGEFPETGRRKGCIEVYGQGRYFTVTGNKLKNYQDEVKHRTDQLFRLYETYFTEPEQQNEAHSMICELSDAQIIAIASSAKNGELFKRLFQGDSSGYRSQSEADEALCDILAFYTRDLKQIERIWETSNLGKRPKFQREDYRNQTIQESLNRVVQHYIPAIPCELEAYRAQAMELLEHGDPIEFIVDSCGRMVLGAEKAFKKLICCISVQNIRQSSGLHPKLSGESGNGKSYLVLTFAHHMPSDMVIKGSMSSKAGFYHNDGDRLLRILDDYQAGNEDLDTVIKQTSSVYHEPYTHRTVANHKPITLQIGSEQTWAITSVDSSQDVQVLNRQIPINVDDSEELTRRVNAKTIERYCKGEVQYPEDETVLICRAIWYVLRCEGYISVRVPFYDRIEWLDTSNRRNPSIFMDMLIAHTAMYRYQRERDKDGFYLATEEDFNAAKELFNDKDAEELVHRLTRKERQFAELLTRHREGLSREEVAEALSISVSRVSQLAYGEKGKGGLTQKLPGFSARDISDTIPLGDGEKRTTKKTIFKLSRYDHLTGFDAVVRLKPQSADSVRDREDAVRNGVRIDDCKEIDSSSIDIDKIDRECKDREEKERGTLLSSCELKSCALSEKSSQPYTEATDSENAYLHHPYDPHTMAADIDIEILQDPCIAIPLPMEADNHGGPSPRR